jgi:hypothetical protein
VLVVADINTIWRSRPFAALSELRPVFGLQPMDPVIAIKKGRFPWGTTESSQQKMTCLSIVLPIGWATRSAAKSLEKLWSIVSEKCRAREAEPTSLVVTSPHYARLVERVSALIPTFYYCSDDYMSYEGWDASNMREEEASVVREVLHSFFVSAALRNRALKKYRVSEASASVSMNATDEHFCRTVPAERLDTLWRKYPKMKRPIVGIVGSVDSRLDYSLLFDVAQLSEVGTLLLVGTITNHRDALLARLLAHPRVVAVNHQPHESLPEWQQLLDVALIPYRESEFNYFCSPMRLFDHLAAGRPIVATSACPQVTEFSEHVLVAANQSEFIDGVRRSILHPLDTSRLEAQRSAAKKETWNARAVSLNQRIG